MEHPGGQDEREKDTCEWGHARGFRPDVNVKTKGQAPPPPLPSLYPSMARPRDRHEGGRRAKGGGSPAVVACVALSLASGGAGCGVKGFHRGDIIFSRSLSGFDLRVVRALEYEEREEIG